MSNNDPHQRCDAKRGIIAIAALGLLSRKRRVGSRARCLVAAVGVDASRRFAAGIAAPFVACTAILMLMAFVVGI